MASTENLQMQLQSARKSILFMETQHASTLKGLHKEIQHLQKKCSELTFDLAMKSADNSEAKVDHDKVSHLETEVADLLQEKISLMQEIEMRDRQLVELEEHAKEQERKYLNEIKTKKHKIAAVINELDARATTIAYLSTQLHQANSKLNKLQRHDAKAFAPTPPAQPRPPSSRRLHQTSKSTDASIRPASTDAQTGQYSFIGKTTPYQHRPSSSSSAEQVQRSEQKIKAFKPCFVPSPMPDPAPFLYAGEKLAEESPPIRPSVLPPIGNSLDSRGKDDNGNLQQSHSAVKYPAKPVPERLALGRAITSNRKTHRNEVRDY
uniref:Coiled-coil domain-containing protein 92-like n=1 Tax=Phallusia mammillata TaxID=59560 RepID=A0A6F9D8V8_9ASCI|nr:coiled-coil domain-containing protein 92-like [Phallusia mammillata]